MKSHIIFIFTLGLASVISNPVTMKSKESCSKEIKNIGKEASMSTADSIQANEVKEIERINNSVYDIPRDTSEVNGNIVTMFNSVDNLMKQNEDYVAPQLQNTDEMEKTVVDGTSTFGDGIVDIVIADNSVPTADIDNATPLEGIPDIQTSINDGLSMTNYLYRNALQSRIEDEIMAKGFAPLPIISIRRKQNNRRRFAIRRRYNRYPYRRYHSTYPYYAFYRPNSLRF